MNWSFAISNELEFCNQQIDRFCRKQGNSKAHDMLIHAPINWHYRKVERSNNEQGA